MAQSINIKIAEKTYPLKVTSPEHEELIRKAADDINRKVNYYLEKFPGKSMVEILSFVSLNVCMANFGLRKQLKEMSEEVDGLCGELQGYLDTIDKNSR